MRSHTHMHFLSAVSNSCKWFPDLHFIHHPHTHAHAKTHIHYLVQNLEKNVPPRQCAHCFSWGLWSLQSFFHFCSYSVTWSMRCPRGLREPCKNHCDLKIQIRSYKPVKLMVHAYTFTLGLQLHGNPNRQTEIKPLPFDTFFLIFLLKPLCPILLVHLHVCYVLSSSRRLSCNLYFPCQCFSPFCFTWPPSTLLTSQSCTFHVKDEKRM